jgi:hypothetical protein
MPVEINPAAEQWRIVTFYPGKRIEVTGREAKARGLREPRALATATKSALLPNPVFGFNRNSMITAPRTHRSGRKKSIKIFIN